MRRYAMSAIMIVTCGASCLGDVVVLKSGRCVTGDVTSVTSGRNGVVFIRVANASQTIFTSQSENMADVAAINRDSAEEKARKKEESDFLEVMRPPLASANLAVAQYDEVLSGFQRFLNAYPNSAHTNSIAQVRQQWLDERNRVMCGDVKWNGTWYQGDAAAKIMTLVKASQLLAAGDQFIGLKNYQAAVGKYREVLAIRPVTTQMLDTVNQKFTAACRQWKSQLNNFNASVAERMAGLDANGGSLRAQIAGYQQELDQNQQRKQLIESAYLIPPHTDPQYPQGHWVVGPYPYRADFGTVRPAVPHFDMVGLQGKISYAQAQLAENEAAKAKFATEQNNSRSQAQNLDAVTREFANAVAAAQKDLLDEETRVTQEAASASRRLAEAAEAARLTALADTAKRAEAAKQAEAAKRAEIAGVAKQEAPAVAAAPAPPIPPQPPVEDKQEFHFWNHWLFLAVVCVLGIFIVLR